MLHLALTRVQLLHRDTENNSLPITISNNNAESSLNKETSTHVHGLLFIFYLNTCSLYACMHVVQGHSPHCNMKCTLS